MQKLFVLAACAALFVVGCGDAKEKAADAAKAAKDGVTETAKDMKDAVTGEKKDGSEKKEGEE